MLRPCPEAFVASRRRAVCISLTSPVTGARHTWARRRRGTGSWSEKKRIEKLKYMHRNPVQRGLVDRREDWRWSSFRHYATGCEGTVEIESEWTARRRERMGVTLRVASAKPTSHPVAPTAGATRVGQPR